MKDASPDPEGRLTSLRDHERPPDEPPGRGGAGGPTLDLADRTGRTPGEAADGHLQDDHLSDEHVRSAFIDAPVGIAVVDLRQGRAGVVLRANPALGATAGLPIAELVGRSVDELIHPDDGEGWRADLLALASGREGRTARDLRWVRSDGEGPWIHLSAAAVGGPGGPRHAVVHAQDVTSRHLAEVELARRALFDQLTGLPNRHLFLENLALALRHLTRRPGLVAVLYIDLDQFKAINDDHGHDEGDRVITEVGSRLRRAVRAHDTPARLHGDEFAVVCTDLPDVQAIDHLVDRVRRVLDRPLPVDGTDRALRASIGVAHTNNPAEDPNELLHRADAAMYEAKRRR